MDEGQVKSYYFYKGFLQETDFSEINNFAVYL